MSADDTHASPRRLIGAALADVCDSQDSANAYRVNLGHLMDLLRADLSNALFGLVAEGWAAMSAQACPYGTVRVYAFY